jgi:hypothetical protein
LLAGAVNVIVAEPDVVLVAVTDVGAPGTVAGVTANEDVEASEVAIPLFAVTANVYAVPLVKPVHE